MTKKHILVPQGYYYIAHPYSNNPEENIQLIKKLCVEYFNASLPIHAPCVHWHEIAKEYTLEGKAHAFLQQNLTLLGGALALHVIKLEGYATSAGVAIELNYAKEHKIPFAMYTYEEAVEWLQERRQK